MCVLVGRFIERTPGNFIFLPQQKDLPAIPVLDAENIAASAVGPVLEVRGVLPNGANAADALQVMSYSLFDPLRGEPPVIETRHRAIVESLAKFGCDMSSLIGAGCSTRGEEPVSSVEEAESGVESSLAEIYAEASTLGDRGLEVRGQAVRATAGVRQQLKSVYGGRDNYPPWSYQLIYENSFSVASIAEKDQTSNAICSGVLISPNHVLTAAHCFKTNHPMDLDVWFGFSEIPRQQFPDPVVFSVTGIAAPSSDRLAELLRRAAQENFDESFLDYIILEIERAEAEVEVEAESEPVSESSVASMLKPQCVKGANPKRGAALYVVGYPNGTRTTVHDNGRVYLPYRVRETQFLELKFEIEVDFADFPDVERVAIVDEFLASYVKEGSEGNAEYSLRDIRFGGQPKLGIVADTFKGNSGSPVYARNNHCVVGILTGGAPDMGQPLNATWQFHETVLPMEAVLSDLASDVQTAQLLDVLEEEQ